jgi:hypothetical protein
MSGPQMVLVEVFADRAAGHYGDNLVRLCRAAAHTDHQVIAVCVQGVHPQIRAALEPGQVDWVDRPDGALARSLLAASKLLGPVHAATRRIAPRGNFAPQVRFLAKALTEAAALRTAARRGSAPVVVLTASHALTATTAALGGVSHVRLVHDAGAPEGSALRGLERLCRGSGRLVTLVCTTESVRMALLARHPWLDAVVQPFTVDDPAMYVSTDERAPARHGLGIADREFAVCMVGGWWDYKDLGIVERGLSALDRPVTLVLVGNPMQPERLEPAVKAAGGRIVALRGSVTETELRQVYAASDCALVTRVPGFDREASTVYDATRYGVPLIVTDHDPTMHDRLVREPTVHLVPAGDGDALARMLQEVAMTPPPRPDRELSVRLGLVTGEAKVAFYEELSARLHNQ